MRPLTVETFDTWGAALAYCRGLLTRHPGLMVAVRPLGRRIGVYWF